MLDEHRFEGYGGDVLSAYGDRELVLEFRELKGKRVTCLR